MSKRTSDRGQGRVSGLTLRLGALLLAFTFLAAACGGSDSYDTGASSDSSSELPEEYYDEDSASASASATTSAPAEDSAMSDDAMEEGEAASDGSGVVSAGEASKATTAAFQDGDATTEEEGDPSSDAPAVVRTIIRRATVHLQVDDVLSASNEATILVESYGGFVFGQETSTEGESRSSITFKVAPADFQKILADIGTLGFLRDQTVSADDVTGRVVDLQSQIKTSETSVERLRAFLAEAKDLKTITDLENSLLQRESQLELLRGQLRTIQSQASLATITAVFTERVPGPAIEVDVTAYLGHDDGIGCIGDDDLQLDESESLTACYRITNTGDTWLSDFTVRDGHLKIDRDEFLEVKEGSLDKPLAPGDHLTLYVQLEADVSHPFLQGQVSAVPSDELGNSLDIEGVAARDELTLEIDQDESLPTFGDGLSGSLATLRYLGTVLVLLAGVLLPFIWILPLAYFLRRWFKNRPKKPSQPKMPQRPMPGTTDSTNGGYVPPPPPTVVDKPTTEDS